MHASNALSHLTVIDLTAYDREARNHNQERLRELARDHGDEVTLICSHDPMMMAGA